MSSLIAISLLKEMQTWHLLALCALLTVFALMEWRKKKKRRFWRILAVLIAIISLYTIYLNPVTLSEKEHQSILLIGEGASPTVKDSLLNNTELHAYQYDAQNRLLQPLSGKNKKVTNFNDLSFTIDTLYTVAYVPPINPLHYKERIKLMDKNTRLSINYPKWMQLGEELLLSLKNESADTVFVQGQFGGDSIAARIMPSSESIISKTTPTVAGPIFGELQINQDEIYHFHTVVQDEQKFLVHLLAESPDFEWRFLKDYLASQGHAVYYRSKISKDKYKSSFSNWPDSLAQQKYTIQPLAFDVLMVDMLAWNNMGSQARNNYAKVLKTHNGAAIFRANPNTSVSLQAIDPSLSERVFSAKENISSGELKLLKISGVKSYEQVNNLFMYKNIFPTISVAFLEIQDTYQWSLAGKELTYEKYWSSVLNQLIRTNRVDYFFSTEWPVEFQPVHMDFWSAKALDSVKIIWNSSDTVAVRAVSDATFPERYQAVYYPDKTGWHQILGTDSASSGFFYVSPASSAAQQLMESAYRYEYYSYLNELNLSEAKNSSNNKEESLIIWFFLLFLLSISFLWIEEKV